MASKDENLPVGRPRSFTPGSSNGHHEGLSSSPLPIEEEEVASLDLELPPAEADEAPSPPTYKPAKSRRETGVGSSLSGRLRKWSGHLVLIWCRVRFGIEWVALWRLRRRLIAARNELWENRKVKKIYAVAARKGGSGKTAVSTWAGALYADIVKQPVVVFDVNQSGGVTANRLGIKREDTLQLREFLRKFRSGELSDAGDIIDQLEWHRETGVLVISSEAVSTEDFATYVHKLGLEHLLKNVQSVICDMGNAIKEPGNFGSVEMAHTLVFPGNVNMANSVVDFKKKDSTDEDDELANTMKHYADLGMANKVKRGIIVVLGAKTKMRRRYAEHYQFPIERVFVIPNNWYMKAGGVVKKTRIPLRIQVILYEILVAMVKAELPPSEEIRTASETERRRLEGLSVSDAAIGQS